MTITGLAYNGGLDATKGAPSGTLVGGTLAQTVASNAAAGRSANDVIPGINSAIADKLSLTKPSQLAATVTLQTGGALLAGTPTNGVYLAPDGLYCVQDRQVEVVIPSSGKPVFAGELVAASGTLGSLRLAAGGAIMGDDFTGYAWPAAGKSGCYYGPEGILLGNANGGAYWQVEANGSMWPPKMTYNSGAGVLTITGAVIVNPDIQQALPGMAGVPASINGGSSLPNDTAWRVYGSSTVTPVNVQGTCDRHRFYAS